MSQDKMRNKIRKQERALTDLIDDQCSLVKDGIRTAFEMGASEYQVLRTLTPTLRIIGNLAVAAENATAMHDAAAHLESVLLEAKGPGRDKD